MFILRIRFILCVFTMHILGYFFSLCTLFNIFLCINLLKRNYLSYFHIPVTFKRCNRDQEKVMIIFDFSGVGYLRSDKYVHIASDPFTIQSWQLNYAANCYVDNFELILRFQCLVLFIL